MLKQPVQKILYLFKLLIEKSYTVDELKEELDKKELNLSLFTIKKYIKRIQNCGIDIEKNENAYRCKLPSKKLHLIEEDVKVIREVRKLLFIQKNYNRIRQVFRLFFRLLTVSVDDETKRDLIDFGYYSTVNWALIRQLQEHCKNKDVILIEYVMHDCTAKKIQIHVDDLKIGEWSEKIYLWGTITSKERFSYLPVERIYRIEKVIGRNVPFDPPINVLTFKISKKLFDEIELLEKEKVIEQDKNFVTIQTPLTDDFYLVQRMMSFCPDLYYISDERIKKAVKDNLKMLKDFYEPEFEQCDN